MGKNKNTFVENGPESWGYILISLFTLLLYFSTIGQYVHFTKSILPMGDPFTYTVGFFNLLDLTHSNFWIGLSKAFSGNWYWLQNLMIVIFSPFLIKEPFSLAMVNFVMWGIASASFYRLSRYLNCSIGLSFIVSSLIWIYPINFGFLDYTSIPLLSLDPIFLGALHVALANTIIFSLNAGKKQNAIIAGASVGLAIWGRGNSLLVVLMIVFLPSIVLLFKIWKEWPAKPYLKNVLIFSIIPICMTVFFYYIEGKQIINYYAGHMAFVQRHQWSLTDAMPYLKNVPGFFFWRSENSLPTIAITLISHCIVLLSLLLPCLYNVKKEKENTLIFLSLTGVFIYFSTYFINILLFTDPLMNIYNCLLIYAPMRIGMTLCIFSLLSMFIHIKRIQVKRWTVLPTMAVLIVYSIFWTRFYTPKVNPDIPTPNEVESFAINLDSLLKGGTLSMLWYWHYNSPILNYYRFKNNLPEASIFRYKFYNDIWKPYDYSEEKRKKVREEIRAHFEKANFIIIPEYVDYYSFVQPYSFYRFRDEFPKYLNSHESPRFVVRMLLSEYGNQRLLVLQGEEEANGKGEPLYLPYGPSTSPHKKDYGPNVIRHGFN